MNLNLLSLYFFRLFVTPLPRLHLQTVCARHGFDFSTLSLKTGDFSRLVKICNYLYTSLVWHITFSVIACSSAGCATDLHEDEFDDDPMRSLQ